MVAHPHCRDPRRARRRAVTSPSKRDVRLRLVEYGAAYLADHWCSKGHIIYVLGIEHKDGKPSSMLSAGMSWQVADGESPAYRVRSETGATVLIVD